MGLLVSWAWLQPAHIVQTCSIRLLVSWLGYVTSMEDGRDANSEPNPESKLKTSACIASATIHWLKYMAKHGGGEHALLDET